MVVAAVALATLLMVSGALALSRANRARHLRWFRAAPARPWPAVVLPPLAVLPMVWAAERLDDAHGRPVGLLLALPVPLASALVVQALHNRRVAHQADH